MSSAGGLNMQGFAPPNGGASLGTAKGSPLSSGGGQLGTAKGGQPPGGGAPLPPMGAPPSFSANVAAAAPFALGGRIPGNYAPTQAPAPQPMQANAPVTTPQYGLGVRNPNLPPGTTGGMGSGPGGFPPPTPVAMNQNPPMAMTARALRGVSRY